VSSAFTTSARTNATGPWKLYVAYEGLPLCPLGCFPGFIDAARAMAEVASVNSEQLSMTVRADVRMKREEGRPLVRLEYEGNTARYVIDLVD